MNKLTQSDLNFVLSRCPRDIVSLMRGNRLYLGGGFIRETIAGNKPNDIDLFGAEVEALRRIALTLAIKRKTELFTTPNAITLLSGVRLPVQFITRWVFADAEAACASFDFTVCQAVIWFENGFFHSVTADDFYSDLAARRLVYTCPTRDEEAGGSLLRVRKFLKRGYNIQAQSLAGVVARLFTKVRADRVDPDEEAVAKVLAGLLLEVDPLRVVDGVELVDEHQAQ